MFTIFFWPQLRFLSYNWLQEGRKQTLSKGDHTIMSIYTNPGKRADIETTAGCFSRSAVKTHFVQIGESYIDLINRYIMPHYQEGDIVSISEKVISLCQKRVVYKTDMKLSFLARFLSKFASHSKAGIGVDSVWKMQFAIDHCGAPKIIWASLCAGAGKLLGKKGVFYDIAGAEVRGLDGFYDRAFQEYGDYGIRLPEDPDRVCNEIYEKTGVKAVIVDANDFTCDILGVADAVPYSRQQLAEMILDNPAGQSDQRTPFVLIRPNGESAGCLACS